MTICESALARTGPFYHSPNLALEEKEINSQTKL